MLSYHSLDLHLPMADCVRQKLHYFGFLTRSLFADSAALSSVSALSSSAACLVSLSPKKSPQSQMHQEFYIAAIL